MSITGVNQAILGSVEYAWVAKLNSGIPAGITGTIANGSLADFRRAKGFTQLAETVPATTFVPVIGDNGVLGTFTQRPQEPVTSDFGVVVFDQVTSAAFDARTVYTLSSSWEISQRTIKCGSLANMALIVNGRAISQETGTVGQEGWYTVFYYNVKGKPTGYSLSGTSADGLETVYSLTMTEVDTLWWEELVATNYNVSYTYASDPIIANYPITVANAKGDAATTAFVVGQTPAAASSAAVKVWLDGVLQTYTTHYAVNTGTRTITMVTAPAAGADLLIAYEFIPTAC